MHPYLVGSVDKLGVGYFIDIQNFWNCFDFVVRRLTKYYRVKQNEEDAKKLQEELEEVGKNIFGVLK